MFYSSELITIQKTKSARWLRAQQQARHEESIRQLCESMPAPPPSPPSPFARRELVFQDSPLRTPMSEDWDRLFEEGRLVQQFPPPVVHPPVGSIPRRFRIHLPDSMPMSAEMRINADRIPHIETLETHHQTQINELEAHRQLHIIARQREAEAQRSLAAVTEAQERLDDLHLGRNLDILALRRRRQIETEALLRQRATDRDMER